MAWSDEPYIVKEGYPFIAVAAFFALFTAASGLHLLSCILLLFTLAVAAFFRNPYRAFPEDPKAILCPADGEILEVEKQASNELLGAACWKISIFMSPLDVHVNRLPATGKLIRRAHIPGHFYVASKPKASIDNERMVLVLETEEGFTLGVVQIAGRLARKIVCYPQEGDRVHRGERFGLIRFGSRVEVYLPEAASVSVQPGDRVKGGEAIMGYFP